MKGEALCPRNGCEKFQSGLSLDDVERKQRECWLPVAIEWEREAPSKPEPAHEREEIPIRARVSANGLHLEENLEEIKAMMSMMDLMMQARSFLQIAQQLGGTRPAPQQRQKDENFVDPMTAIRQE